MADKKNDPTFVVGVDSNPVNTRTHRKTSGILNPSEAFSPDTLKKLSDVRRGQFKVGTGVTGSSGAESILAKPVLAHGKGFKKGANTGFTSPEVASSAGRNVDRLVPEIYSPLFQVAKLNLPRDRMTMNAWNRNFFDTHPIVRNAITLHATYPISKINIKCKNRKVEQFFNDMAERIDLFDAIAGVAFEFWKMGEAFPYAELDEANGMWSSIVIQNPDYIKVQRSIVSNTPIISLRPDATLERLVNSTSPSDIKMRQQIPDHIIHHIKRKEPIPLDNFNVTHLKMLSSPYDIRGTSIIVSCYKDLMLYDKLREAKFAQADDLINPITLVQVGGNAEAEYHPSQQDLEYWRQIIEEAQYDKDFKIISHAGIKIDRVGAAGAVIDTTNDFNFIRENLYAGLMVPKAIMDQEGAAYASASVGLEVLRTRYVTFRNMIEKWLEKKIFAPISELQDFYEYHDKERVLTVPQVDWNHINLYDLNDYIQSLGNYVGNGQVSLHTLYRSLGLNWEEEQRLLREEAIRKQIMEKEMMELKKKPLSELRAIGPDDVVIESDTKEEPVAGETPGEEENKPGDLSGGAPSGGGLDLGGGGLPSPGGEAPPATEGPVPGTPPGGGSEPGGAPPTAPTG